MKDVALESPHNDGRNNNQQIADGSVRQKVAGLAHEVVPAFGAFRGRIQVSVEDFSSLTDGTTKVQEGSKVQRF